MISYEIHDFIEKLNHDLGNKDIRRRFHENYEWLESYQKRKFGGNNSSQLFCNNHGDFFWGIDELRNIAKRLTVIRPVGSSNNHFNPTLNIYRATYFLKYKSNLHADEDIEEMEGEVEHANKWTSTSFIALFSIIKQIRDNLFHGQKIDLDPIQYARNIELVQIGAELTDVLLINLVAAETNHFQN